jgi:hypothetical protein
MLSFQRLVQTTLKIAGIDLQLLEFTHKKTRVYLVRPGMFSSSFKPIALKLDPGRLWGRNPLRMQGKLLPMTSCSYDFNDFMTDFQGVLQRNRLSQKLLGEVGQPPAQPPPQSPPTSLPDASPPISDASRQFPKRPQEFSQLRLSSDRWLQKLVRTIKVMSGSHYHGSRCVSANRPCRSWRYRQ